VRIAVAFLNAVDAKNVPDIHLAEVALPKEIVIIQNLNNS